jgi:predicted nuclease of restriction endonuclease-like (RecB) superfamily
MKKLSSLKSYTKLISEIKTQIQTTRSKAALAVNRELILLYFRIGNLILEKQKAEGWGSKIVERISQDLRDEFPDMKGLSTTNLFYMRKFAETYRESICQQLDGEIKILHQAGGEFDLSNIFNIPWRHHTSLMDMVSSDEQRFWYIEQTIKNNWSRNILIHQIKSDLYRRQVSATKSHNFHLTLPKAQSKLVESIFKDEYNFDFIYGSDLKEKNLEEFLVENVTKFLLELGRGFAFIGKQYQVSVGGQDFFIDLLFYNFELRCFVVIELKTGEFKPEYVGKMSFYLSVIDEKLKNPEDKGAIGIILCSKNNKEITKHATRYVIKPLGVSEYKTTQKITDKNLRKFIPSAEELQKIGRNN